MRLMFVFSLLLGLTTLPSAIAQNGYPVHFSWGTAFFPDNFQAIRENPGVSPTELVNGYYFRFIQCKSTPNARERAGVEADGVRFITYIPVGVYLVALPGSFDVSRLEAIRVRSIMPLQPGWKLAQNLREEPYGAWAVHGDQIDINLQVFAEMRISDAATLLRQGGITVLVEGNQNGFIAVRCPKAQLGALAALPFIAHLELAPPPGEPEDINGRSLHRSNLLDIDYPNGKKYNGAGVKVMVRDDGPIGPHIDFQGRNTNVFAPGDPANNSHGDGVGGIMAGAGNLNPVMKGMAAGADIFTIRYRDDFQDNTLQLFWDENVTITNSSYSNGCNAGYTLTTQTVDEQLYDNPTLMHVFSAGNENGSNCGYGAGNQWGNITGGHKMGKNCITTANVLADATIASSSSRGPAHDGRLKPDISAHGNFQNSTDANNTYQVFSGTSAAAPGIAGCLAQLTQAYKEIYSGEEPEAAVLKTAILNTANDLGNVGPDFKFGWGLINTYRAYQLLLKKQWMQGVVDHGQVSTHAIQIPGGTRLAKIMIYWPDFPASLFTDRALIDDLDLSVVAPDGTVSLPWLLDPTPDPVILNTPAGKGRDSLNNMEQVALVNPAPGTYVVNINGYDVPFGIQQYILAWEFISDEIKITYPTGGEGLVPGETTRIHWDAYGNADNFTLRYSLDNGKTWLPITTVTGEKRFFDWVVPQTTNGQVRLLLQRLNITDTTDYPLTISPVPTDLKVDRVCPDSMTISWSPVANDSLLYDVYLLGQKYMEWQGTTDTTTFTMAIPNPELEKWFSVRTSYPDGLAGRRAIAVQWEGQLKNCIQPDDIGLRKILSPTPASALSCAPIVSAVRVRITNEGMNVISGAKVSYQLNAEPVVSEDLPDLPVGDTLDFAFQQPVSISKNGQNTLRIWSTYAAEDVFFNDTLTSSFNAIVSPFHDYFQEGFQGNTFPPIGWAIENPDDDLTWSKTTANITGANGQPTRAIYIDCFDYPNIGAEDFLYMPPLDLTSLSTPGLRFDVAHANYPDQLDSLRIEVLANCDLNGTPVIIWQKAYTDLATTGASNSQFTPNAAQDWRTEAVSLKDFTGQTIIVRFVSTNGYGNDIYLDNIGLFAYSDALPVANFTSSADTICRLDTVRYSALPAGLLSSYNWIFGSGAIPSTAYGQGPHAVFYLTSGNKNVSLIVTNPIGSDTLVRVMPVLGTPLANYTWSANGPTVTFANSSTNATIYSWDFGDGASSSDANPVHTYAVSGDYTAVLTAANTCRSSVKAQTFNVNTTGATDHPIPDAIWITPNPTEGDFRVELTIRQPQTAVQFQLFDMQGRLMVSKTASIPAGNSTVAFSGLNLPKSLYQLVVQTESGVQTFRVAVQ